MSEEIAALDEKRNVPLHGKQNLTRPPARLQTSVAFRPRRAQPVSGQADVSYGRTVCLDVGGVDPTPTARDMHPDYRDASRAQVVDCPIDLVNGVCTSSSSPSMNWISDPVCPATTPTLYGGKSLSESHFSSSRN